MKKRISLVLALTMVIQLLFAVPMHSLAGDVSLNFGFEEASLDSAWGSYGYPFNASTQLGTQVSLSGDQARTGNGSLKAETNRVDAYGMYGAQYQMMNPDLSASYTVSGYMKVPQEWDGKKARVYVYYRTSSGSSLGNPVNSGEFVLSSDDWTELSYTIAADQIPENTGRIDIIFAFPKKEVETASAENPAVFYLDDVTIAGESTASPEEIRNLKITGSTMPGNTVTASYQYEGSQTCSFQWLIGDTADGAFTEIEDETQASYLVREEDLDRYIRVRVTPGTDSALTKVSDAALISNNLATDGGFESGTSGTWKVYGSSYNANTQIGTAISITEQEKKSGSYALMVETKGVNTGYNMHGALYAISGDQWDSSKRYIVKGQIKMAGDRPRSVRLVAYPRDEAGKAISGMNPKYVDTSVGNEWTEVANIFQFDDPRVKMLQIIFSIPSKDAENSVFYLDDVYIAAEYPMPEVLNLSVEGSGAVGQTLTAKYDYVSQVDTEENCTYQWLRGASANASDWEEIEQATQKSYVVTEQDADCYLKVVVTPHQSVAPKTGESVTSAPVVGPFSPAASNAAIAGGGVVGRTLEVVYDYTDANGDEEEGTSFRWLWCDRESDKIEDYTPISGASEQTYLVDNSMENRYLCAEVTPKNGTYPTTGKPVYTAPILISSGNSAPSVEHVQVNTLFLSLGYVTASYDYSDPEQDGEGESRYAWYISDTLEGEYTLLEGETQKNLIVTSDMIGRFVKVKVTPVDVFGQVGQSVESEGAELVYQNFRQLFVAQDGDDQAGDGSFEKPFASIAKARDTIRIIRQAGGLPEGGITVYVRGGTYLLEESVLFTQEDSGTEDCPIVYRNYKDEKVTLSGGAVIDASKAEPLPQDIKSRIIEADARDHIVKIDLAAQGIPVAHYNIPYIKTADVLEMPELFVDSEAMTVARWPNEGFVAMGTVIDPGSNERNGDTVLKPFTFTYQDSRIEQWADSDDKWMFGQWYWDWYGEHVQIGKINKNAKTITTVQPSYYSARTGQRYYYFNVLEEIDQPGEYFLDMDQGVLYLYPKVALHEDTSMSLSYLKDPMIVMKNADYIRIQGFSLSSSKSDGIIMNDSSNTVVDRCDIFNLGKWGVKINGGKNQTVQNCHIYNTGTGGVYLNTGNRKTLESGNTVVENCEIHKTDRLKNNFAPTIAFYGVGSVARHNKLYDTNNLGVALTGNENLLEYNELFGMIQQTSDIGAVYGGRNPTTLGNKIMYNYFHDITSNAIGPHQSNAIFFDDGYCNATIYGNIFYHAGKSSVFRTYGGYYFTFENNISVARPNGETPSLTRYLNWKENWVKWLKGEWPANNDHKIPEKLIEMDVSNPPYSEKYPWLIGAPNIPVPANSTNKVLKNVAVGHTKLEENTTGATVSDNWLTADDPGFVDMENRNLNLRADSEVFTKIPDFEPLPFDQMGMYPKIVNQKPAAMNVTLLGKKMVGEELLISYLYRDIEGDLEDNSVYEWLAADSQSGNYQPISGQNGVSLLLTEELAGKYVKVRVTPVDEAGSVGDTVESEAVSIIKDAETLGRFIEEAKAALEQSQAGTALGQYPQQAMDDLQQAISSAEEIYQNPSSSISAIESEAGKLAQAMELFYSRQITKVTVNDGETLTIPAGLKKVELEAGTVKQKIQLRIPEGKLPVTVLDATVGERQISLSFPEGAQCDSLSMLQALDQPTFPLFGKVDAAFVAGETAVQGPMRIVIKGAADKTVVTKNGPITYFMSEDSAAALGDQPCGVLTSGEDLILWSRYGDEFAVADVVEPSHDATLSEIRINGKLYTKFRPDTEEYQYFVSTDQAVVEAVAADENASVSITQADSLPGTAVITVTAQDQTTTKTYRIKLALMKENTPEPAPSYVPDIGGSSGGISGGSIGGFVSTGGSKQNQEETKKQSRFVDMIGHWAEDDVNKMAEQGIVSGVTLTTFEPDRSITRAEFAAIVTRALGLSPANSDAVFEDVPSDQWYAKSVAAAAAAGLISGYEGKFRPEDTITREEMAVVVMKAYVFLGKSAAGGGIDRFADKEDISPWAYASVDQAVGAGLISGITANTFAPGENATRAQAASLIKRLLNQ